MRLFSTWALCICAYLMAKNSARPMYAYYQGALIIEVRLFMDVYSSKEETVHIH